MNECEIVMLKGFLKNESGGVRCRRTGIKKSQNKLKRKKKHGRELERKL